LSEISADKREISNFSQTLKDVLKQGEIWNRGKVHHWLRGMDAPGQYLGLWLIMDELTIIRGIV